MNTARSTQLVVFLLALVIPGALFTWQAWHLLPLYTNSVTREKVKTAMVSVADREGWLLSDLSVTDVRQGRVRLLHREHRRDPRPETCSMLLLSDSSLHPCDGKPN